VQYNLQLFKLKRTDWLYTDNYKRLLQPVRNSVIVSNTKLWKETSSEACTGSDVKNTKTLSPEKKQFVSLCVEETFRVQLYPHVSAVGAYKCLQSIDMRIVDICNYENLFYFRNPI
jgi:hypothetical protein